MLVNLRDGWNSLVGLIAEQHSARQVQVISTAEGTAFQKHVFQLWQNRREQRLVAALRDDTGWTFNQRGAPLPFENPSNLSRARKSERLNRRLLYEYLQALGWNIRDAGFWKSNRPATYFEQIAQRH